MPPGGTVTVLLLLALCHLTSSEMSTKKGADAVVTDVRFSCPADWQLVGSKCLRVFHSAKSWPEALASCSRYGSELARLESSSENAFAAGLLAQPGRQGAQHQFWIGLMAERQPSGDASFVWSDGSAASRYLGFWDLGQPDHIAGSCTLVSLSRASLLWKLDHCSLLRDYVCQRPACLKGSFFCASGGCVPESLHCNGHDDCRDLSDELNCPASHSETSCLVHEKGESGKLSSPNYPSSYKALSNCRWIIEGPINSRIQLSFDFFETEPDTDILSVFDGGPAHNSTTVLSSLSGALSTPLTLYSTTNLMELRFRSDAQVHARGFQAHWKAVPFSCGGSLTAQSYSQSFSSPNYPQLHNQGMECVWTVKAPQGQLLTLSMEDVQLGPGDVVYVHDGPGPANALLTTLRGNLSMVEYVVSTSSEVYVYMKTGRSSQGRGFSIGYRKGCDVTVKQSHGWISSPGNLAVQYPHSALCTYSIELPDGHSAQAFSLQVNNFDMGLHDHLKIFEGSTKGRALHEGDGFSGDVPPPSQLAIRQGRAQLVFQSNAVRNAQGFNISFSLNCPVLKTPALVTLSTKNNAFGTKVDVSCPVGFEFVSGRGKSFQVECQPGGLWTDSVIPNCQPVYCSAVPQIANGFASAASNVSFGGVATYSCYSGFVFSSGASQEKIYCAENGKWTQPPHCRAATCPVLAAFSNGNRKLEYGEGTGYGTVFRFECRSGFRRKGVSTLLCQADGTWSDEQPTCHKLPCANLPTVANGQLVAATLLLFGDVAKVICDSGFRADGPNEVECLSNQQLSPVPSCVDVDECAEGSAHCASPSTRCQNMPGGYECQCLQGFQPQLVCASPSFLSASLLSLSSGISSPSLLVSDGWCATALDPIKTATIQFPVPKVIEKIRFDKAAAGYATQVKLRYQLRKDLPLEELAVDGMQTFDLQPSNTGGDYLVLPYSIEASVLEISIVTYVGEPCFKADILGCQKSSCADINECMKNNGNCEHTCINKEGAHQCACREGFDLFVENGQGGVLLEENETGHDEMDVYRFNKSCIARSCPLIQSPQNGILLSTLVAFRFPVVVEFQCHFGFQMMGPQFVQCLADGSWNGTTPFCLPATCQGVSPSPSIGLMVSPDNATVAYGQSVSLSCSQQNRPARRSPLSTTRECIFDPQPDGRDYWMSGPAPDCPLVDCGAPPTLAGADYQGDHSTYQMGSTLEFTCRPPYSLVGKSSNEDSFVRCTEDAVWDLGDLRCEGPVCVDPGFPIDGSVSLDSVEEGAVARFDCNRPGFHPFPSSSIQCALGAACVLSEDVGISSGFIPDGAFADNSDSTIPGYEPHKSRMSSTGWCGSKDAFIFLSVDMQRVHTLTSLRMAGVAGSGHLRGHVTKMQLFFKTQFSQNYDTYPVEFETPSGNHNAMHQFELNPPLRARYILLGVAEYEGSPCIRFDMLGCIAPATVSHDTPTHLQVGWNGTVPQCIDAEPPKFVDCPVGDIKVESDENGQLKEAEYRVPTAEDNSGRVAYVRVEPEGFLPGRPVSVDTDVVYTAFDDAGNTAECVVRIRIPDTLPPVMKCPDSYSLAARDAEMRVEFNTTTVPMVIQDVSNITEIIFSPSYAILRIGQHVEVEVTSTDAHANRNKCRFQVAYMAESCSFDSLSTANGTERTCARRDGQVVCSVSCSKGYRFVDEQTVEKQFTCSDGRWTPSAVAPACIPIADEPARYELSVAINYPSSSPVADHCLQGYSEMVLKSFDNLDTVLSQRCSSSVQIFVRFLEATFTNHKDMVVGNYSIQILPSVLDSRFYELCGLTLRTIFDLNLPGATTPVKSLLSLAGESISTPAVGCPTIVAMSTSAVQGFGCAKGEVLRQASQSVLPECLPCPVGSAMVNNTCLPCPQGSYQDKRGQVACQACPDSTHTLDQGSHTVQSCLAVCGNGMFSETGLVPCQLCPRHSFSGPPIHGGYKQCSSCPSGTYTAKLGSSGPSQCKQPCEPGTFSVTGLAPCSPCPLHHYQPAIGQQRCLQCSNTTATASVGSAAEASCQPVDCVAMGCENNADCLVRSHRGECQCRPGFIGEHCESPEPVCLARPCANGAQCEEVAGSFRCICPPNFTGARCQFGVDECLSRVCPNGGVCHDLPGPGTTKCLCRTGFAGENCDEIEDICSSANPCRNGADCEPSQLGRFRCRCLPGWEGATCEINIDDCASSPCALNSTCTDLINDFECKCPPGFTGKRCHVKEDLCAGNPCEHGICVDSMHEYKCICEAGWTGERCSETVNECAKEPCKNGATCTQQLDGFKCLCAAGYLGVHCQHQVDHCAALPCSNNATCTNLGPSYHCGCRLGYAGIHCEHDVDDCQHARCNAVGTESCQDGVNSFKCMCKAGYSGELCDEKIDQCMSSPCLNNGTCMDVGATFVCECAQGWTGQRCEIESGPCQTNPCRNDGHCVAMGADYFCVCPEGVSGRDCEVAPNRCLGEPCLNGGVCGDFGSRLECSCPKQFSGEGCQYSSDPCSSGICQNDARCVAGGKDLFTCHCQPGFTGLHCESNIDDCATSPCPLGATCLDQIHSVHCQCPFNLTGPNCDRAVDEDFDLVFSDSLRPSSASLAVPFRLHSRALSLSLWVKFSEAATKGTVLTIYSSSQPNFAASLSPLLTVSADGVVATLIPAEPPLQLHFPANQNINDGAWNHLVFSWNSEMGSYSVIWNSVQIFSDGGYGTGKELLVDALIQLGSDDSSFAGSVTRVHVWDRVLDFESEIPLLAVDCHPKEPIFSGLLVRFAGYSVLKGKVERVPRSQCGRLQADADEQSASLYVEDCPSDQLLVTSLRESNVTWPEPVFHSKMPIVKVEKNIKPGQVFTWGEYDVLYVATDNSSNSAHCNFKVRVSREHCPALADPVNGVQACEAWGHQLKYKACSIECRAGFEFPVAPPLFYSCAADGRWTASESAEHDTPARLFRYPQCSKSIPASRVLLMRVSYPASSLCSDASKEALRTKLTESINRIHKKWDICTEVDASGCVGARVDVDCASEMRRRAKREEAHSFLVRIELPVKRSLVVDSSSGQKLQVADAFQDEVLAHGAFNLEKVLPNGRPDLSSFHLLDEFHCQPGHVTVRDVCVPCSPGTYFSPTSSICEPCPVGTYQPLAGRLQCFTCPEGTITPGTSSIAEDECKANCPPGHFFDYSASKCTPCGVGFFQSRGGSFSCVACHMGKTTLSDRATSEEECRDECPDGEQLSSSGSCQPCAVGSFRTRGEHKQCTRCPAGTTTESDSSVRRAQCNTPLCKAGQFLVRETKHCQFCPRGTFQDTEQQTVCKLCPTDHTTAAQGATAESQCYSTNQCATGEDDCSWHANCIDLPDENDVPSFQCKCKPGYRGNGTHCFDACTNYCLNDAVCKKNPVGYVECECKENFSGERCEVRFQPRSARLMQITGFIIGVVVILIIITSIIFMISCRNNRAADIMPEKTGIDDLPQTNFIYGRPPAIEAPRPVGYYYEDDDEYESKTMYVTGGEDDNREMEHRMRVAQQHMYRPSNE